MRKTVLLFSAMTAMVAAATAQTTIYQQNFNSTSGTTLPAGWSQTGTGWKTGTDATLSSPFFTFPDLDGRRLEINDGADPDYHNQLVRTGSINLSAYNGSPVFAKFNLTFLGAIDNSTITELIVETLTLEASTDGGATWTVVKILNDDHELNLFEALWQVRYVDLSDYAGEPNVMIGFRYSDNHAWLYGAAIDNFSLIVPPVRDLSLVSVSPVQGAGIAYGNVGAAKSIRGTVMNNSGATFSSYVVKYQQGSGPVQSYTRTVNLPPFSYDDFTHNVPFVLPATGEYPLKVWVTATGDQNVHNDSAMAYAAAVDTTHMPVKRLVFEDATGTWCGWCPSGTVAMDAFVENHPGAAAQIVVHSGDPMTINAYATFINPYLNNYPDMVVDRRTSYSPTATDIETVYETHRNDFSFAAVTLGNVSVNGNIVTVPVTVKPFTSLANSKLALVVTESNIKHINASDPPGYADSLWMQTNYYSGGELGPMGGWEALPEHVPDTRYHFVARSITPSPAGGAGLLPVSMATGVPYQATLSATLDPSWNKNNLQYIVLLIGPDGALQNSNYTALPHLDPVLPNDTNHTTAIIYQENDIHSMRFYPNPVSDLLTVSFNMPEATDAALSITDITGRPVYTRRHKLNAGKSTIAIPAAGLCNGVYLVTAVTNKGRTSRKVVVHH